MNRIIEVIPIEGFWRIKDATIVLYDGKRRAVSAKRYYGFGWRKQLEAEFEIPLTDLLAAKHLGYRIVADVGSVAVYHVNDLVEASLSKASALDYIRSKVAEALAW